MNMNTNRLVITVSFKLFQPDTRWEDINNCLEIPFPNCIPTEQIKDIAFELAQEIANKRNKEVRWEYNSSGQGHYVMPNHKAKHFIMLLDPNKRKNK